MGPAAASIQGASGRSSIIVATLFTQTDNDASIAQQQHQTGVQPGLRGVTKQLQKMTLNSVSELPKRMPGGTRGWQVQVRTNHFRVSPTLSPGKNHVWNAGSHTSSWQH
jgi:hypothetical protein